MGNDIFSAVINKKKNMILEYSNIFFKYTVNDKNKITKTLSSIIDIYLEQYYLNQENNFDILYNYFALQNSKDKLLKETIASTIKFYHLNNIADKIENDRGTIILISNVVYLAVSLCNRCFNNYDGNVEIIVEQFLAKYSFKIRIKTEETIEEMKKSLISSIKRDRNNLKKAFKLFNSTNYQIELKKVYDYDNHYFVELNYDIKPLSKYHKKEVERTVEKSIVFDLALVMLEQTILKITYDYLDNCFENKYLIKLPIEIFEKQKYYKYIEELFAIPIIKKNIIFLFEHNEIDDDKIMIKLKNEGFYIGFYQINSLKVHSECFDNVDFVLVPPHFFEMHDGYQEIWKAKGIKFIIS